LASDEAECGALRTNGKASGVSLLASWLPMLAEIRGGGRALALFLAGELRTARLKTDEETRAPARRRRGEDAC
jgi:hypothetical protein